MKLTSTDWERERERERERVERWKEEEEVVPTRDFHQGWRVKINLVVRDGWQCEAHDASIYLCSDCSVWSWYPVSHTEGEREGDRNRKLTGRFPSLWSPPAEFDQNGATLSAFPTMETSGEHSRDKREWCGIWCAPTLCIQTAPQLLWRPLRMKKKNPSSSSCL